MASYCFSTVVTSSHFRGAAALSAALHTHHPEAETFALLLDPPSDLSPLNSFGMNILTAEMIAPQLFREMKIYYSPFELSNASKPFLLRYLLTLGFDRAIYLDSDVFPVGRFVALLKFLEHSSFVLTPHITRPELARRSVVPVHQIADLGLYNGGMWGVRNDASGVGVMAWLMEFIPELGFDDRSRGMFVDQKILPLAAQLFGKDFACLSDPTYNVAYWNVHERHIERRAGQYLVNSVPASFFHLSGFDPGQPTIFSRYASSLADTFPVLQQVVAEYTALLPNIEVTPSPKNRLNYFDGRLLTREMRHHYFINRTMKGFRLSSTKLRLMNCLRALKSKHSD